MSNADLRAPAETAMRQCMNLTSEESCVIVTDEKREHIAAALYDVGIEITDDIATISYPVGNQHGSEPSSAVAAAMAGADVFLAPTTKSLSHTTARSNAIENGSRGATLPGITEEVFITGLNADYERIATACEEVLEQVRDATEIRVTSPQGTDISIGLGDRSWLPDTGIVHDAGDFSNLPAGEVFISPETATGKVVVDGTMRPYGLLEQPVVFTVEDGYVTEMEDDAVRAELEEAAVEVGEDAYNFAELGIGTNVGVTELIGSVLLDEKAGGTVHMAIGDNHGIGGDTVAPIHMDGILREPTVFADGEKVRLPTA